MSMNLCSVCSAGCVTVQVLYEGTAAMVEGDRQGVKETDSC